MVGMRVVQVGVRSLRSGSPSMKDAPGAQRERAEVPSVVLGAAGQLTILAELSGPEGCSWRACRGTKHWALLVS